MTLVSPVVTQKVIPGRSRPTPKPPPLRLLVVEDDADTSETLEFLLDLNGFEVQSAPDGPTALEMSKEFRPEVVLLDIGLPGMDGWEVARRLRAECPAQPPLLVAITGYGRAEDRLRSQRAGIDLHLLKPTDPEQLIGLLKRFQSVVR
jgi:CheY-like chemotaxis protein